MSENKVLSFEPKSILLPRFDTLGDLVLLEGFIEALQLAFPQAKITLFIRRPFADLAALFPATIDWAVTDIDPHSQTPGAMHFEKLVSDLGEGHWDLLLATAHNRTWAEDLLAARLRGRAQSLALGQWTMPAPHMRDLLKRLGLTEECPYDQILPVNELSHEVQKYRDFWRALSGESLSLEPRLYISEDLSEIAGRMLAGLGLRKKGFGLVFPAGTRRIAIKAWPAERFAAILAWMEKHCGLPALVAGHVSETAKIREVAALATEMGAHPVCWLGRDGEVPNSGRNSLGGGPICR